MRHIARFLTPIAAAALAAVIALMVSTGSDSRAQSSSRPLPNVSQGRCPKTPMQALPGDALAGATHAALDEAPAIYRGTNLKGVRATAAILAHDNDPGRGAYARVKCGRQAEDRTVVVSLEFPSMRPSASLSEGIVLVSRFSGRYRVWAQLH